MLAIALSMSGLNVQGAFSWVKWYNTYSGWSIGTGSSLDWKVGARWTAADLTTAGIMSGDRITKVKIAVAQTQYISSCAIEIYQGGSFPYNQGTLVHQQSVPVGSLRDGDTTVIALTNQVSINTGQELWIVYRIVATGGYPFGRDNGNAINEKGNIMYVNNAWTTLLTAASYDNNWVLEFYTETTPPTIITSTLPNGGIGKAYSQTLTAAGTPPITWSKDSGNPPTGLSILSNGQITGTPATAGTFNFTVKATNIAGSTTKALSITIDSMPTTPINLSAYQLDTTIVVLWQAVSSATSYNIYHSSSAAGTYTKIGSSNTSSYTDNNPPLGDNYYKVTAVNLSGESPQSNYLLYNLSSTPNRAQVRFQKKQSYQYLTQIAVTDVSITVLAGCNFGTSAGISNYFYIPSGQHILMYNNSVGWNYCLPSPYTYNFQTGRRYTITGDYDGTRCVFQVIDDGILIVAPAITTSNLPDGATGVAYSQTLAASGDAPITWTRESGNLPNGLSFSANGEISGTPTKTGTYNFIVKATNGGGNDTKTLSIKVTIPTPKSPTNLSAYQSDYGVAVIWTAVTDATSYNIYRSSSETGTYTKIGTSKGIKYVDDNFPLGDNYYKVSAVNDGGESAESDFVLCSTSSYSPGKAEVRFQKIRYDENLTLMLVVDAAIAELAYTTFPASAGISGYASIPAGKHIPAFYRGSLYYCLPDPYTYDFKAGGKYTVVCDNNGSNLTFYVKDESLQPPVITTQNLSNGTIEMAYSQTLTASGDVPITWSRASGTLPNGLTLSASGVISGTPKTAGTFDFTVKATNSAGSSTKAFSIEIGGVGIFDNCDIETKAIRVYPNPTDGELRVVSYNLQKGVEVDYAIFNLIGQEMMQGKLSCGDECVIDVASLPSGVYYLRLAEGRVKFVKQ